MKMQLKFKSKNLKKLSAYDSMTILVFECKKLEMYQKHYEKIIRYKNKFYEII